MQALMDMIPLFGDVFDRRAAAAPDAVAVEYQGRQLTYGQLAARSASLAAGLVRRGVRRDSLVGVAVGPSLDLPAAILGVLRAGGAWLPLDPSYPADRLRYMIDDSAVRLVLATSGTADRVAVRGVEVIDLDGPADDGPEPPEADRPAAPRVHPASLAYVIYTSGSTGRPKGVALTQRGLANLALAQRLPFEAGPGDRVLQFAPTSFDASVFETVMALYAGATLVLAPRDEIAPGPPLADFLRDQRITHVTLPPSV